MYQINHDFKEHISVNFKQLQSIMDEPVLHTECIHSPVFIKSVEMLYSRNYWFLRVRSKDGSEGLAPCSDRSRHFFPILQHCILPHLIGKDARYLENHFQAIFVEGLNYKIQGLAYWCCIAWIEAAILDLLGKTAKLPATDLIGPRVRDEIDLYVASGNRNTTPEEEIAVLEEAVNRFGVQAIKFKLGGRMSRNADSMKGRTEGLLYLARKHFGEKMVIHTDGNGSFDAEKGIVIGKICEEINAYFYEEPCPFDDLWATKEVSDALQIPIAFGEQETSLRRFAWLIEKNAAQILQPDLQYTGGFIQCVKIAKMAAAAGKVVTPHVSGGYTSYNMLLYCSIIPNIGHYHEHKGFKGVEDCISNGLAVKNGKIKIPTGIGLGLDLQFLNKEPREAMFLVE